MTIAKADILSAVQTRTGRAELTAAECDLLLAAVLREITVAHPVLETSAAVAVAAGGRTGSLPAGFRSLVGLTGVDGRPLTPAGAWDEYLDRYYHETETSEPETYCIFNGTIYVHPGWTAGGNLTLYYAYDTATVSTIALPDRWSEALIEGVCFKTYESRGEGDSPEAMVHKGLHENAILNLAAVSGPGVRPRKPVAYCDL